MIYLEGMLAMDSFWVKLLLMSRLEDRGYPTEIYDPYELALYPERSKGISRENEEVRRSAKYILYFLGPPGVLSWSWESSESAVCNAVMALYDDPTRTMVTFFAQEKDKEREHINTTLFNMLRKRFPQAGIFKSVEATADWLAAKYFGCALG